MKVKGKRKKVKEATRLLGASLLPGVFLLLSVLLLSSLRAVAVYADSSAVSTSTSDGRLRVFDDVWETVRERYYDPTFHGLDWQAERERFRPLAARAQSATELYNVLRRLLGQLRDAHTRVYAPEERFDWRHPRFIGVGISVRELDGLLVVVRVERDSEAERAGLRAGDLITNIDNESALDVFARRLTEQPGSSTLAAARSQAMAKLFEGKLDIPLSITWLGADGHERRARLRRQWRERETALRVRLLRDHVGLVGFDVFTQAAAVDFMRALSGKLRDARALIIDLRQNGGGEAEAMTEVASAFLPAGKSLGRFMDRGGRIQFEPHTRTAMLFAPDAIKSFNRPIIILTSERTSSAAEIFVAALREARRAIVVGQNTCGCVLAVRRRHSLPDGGELDVSEMDYATATGTRLEGVGLAPDEEAKLDRVDLRAGRDRAVERALKLLTGEGQ